MGSEGQQDIEMAILTALLKGIIRHQHQWLSHSKLASLYISNRFSYDVPHMPTLVTSPSFFLHQERTHQQQTSSVWLWPGTEWISHEITSLFTDTICQ